MATGYLDAAGASALGASVVSGTAVSEPEPVGGAASVAVQAQQENLFWQSILDSTDPAEFRAYLEQFPNGVFAGLARRREAALRASASDAGASDPAPVNAPRPNDPPVLASSRK